MDVTGPRRPAKTFVLCFDGTGDEFTGTETDSNVLKIFRMLDRSQGHQFHYYQPGIGTYVNSTSLSNTGIFSRVKNAYVKMKDEAIGTSFDQHVMGGYKFLMRYYSHGDLIYFIGFSRGSYIARFLAEMLDYIGLLEAGNEELIQFAWKTFAKWQRRAGHTKDDRKEKHRQFQYMKAFRETFSRPIGRIQFLGLFDTVNSVPEFETAWMNRSRFPYTARSSARVIRHAVSIDERRAKFRQDLISEVRSWANKAKSHKHSRTRDHPTGDATANPPTVTVDGPPASKDDERRNILDKAQDFPEAETAYREPPVAPLDQHTTYRPSLPASKNLYANLRVSIPAGSTEDLLSTHSGISLALPEAEEEAAQDIQEVWFPGSHGDIGGGWTLAPGEIWALSHGPLLWMVQEAQQAGLQFDAKKLKQFECNEEYTGDYSPIRPHDSGEALWEQQRNHDHEDDRMAKSRYRYHRALTLSSTGGVLHDCLEFGKGLRWLGVVGWWIMELLPIRRMELQPDGSWKPIRWPLPRGEVRDIPDGAQIHVSAIRRMQSDPTYRPGNLIIGGGGREVREAPANYGIGEWVVFQNEGDTVRETYVRKCPTNSTEDHSL